MSDYKKDLVIAKYMEAKHVPNKTMNTLMRRWESEKMPLLNGKFVSGNELKFGSDYNWILPVVQKLKLNIDFTLPIDQIRDICYNEILKTN